MTLLSCTSLTASLGRKQVLDAVSFAVDRPQLIGLIGPNGAGKSTLLKTLAGVLDHGGDVQFRGQDHRAIPAPEKARSIAYMPQERVVHWDLACRDVVLLGRLPYRGWAGRASTEDRQATDDAMGKMDVLEFANRPFNQLSGGEQARVLLARLLAQSPALVLADEPTNGLDPAHQIGLMKTFRSLVDEGKTVILSLHDLTLAAAWCDRLLLLDHGRMTADGPPETVLQAETLRQVYGVETEWVTTSRTAAVIAVDISSSRTPRET
ncbi:ABC transporter ATP-binding protein [Sneathiella chinensis]|uniref:ABC transporter n=1 Tax=Sneathiella chinensis TaxID=349750 RepID=A0ABQ5U3X3_9PROT|nr:ABC transporter ATP-binding protein [Sneathiella chinensis]GLQ06872.1 ABC transporter [Sneathiella chinensis]